MEITEADIRSLVTRLDGLELTEPQRVVLEQLYESASGAGEVAGFAAGPAFGDLLGSVLQNRPASRGIRTDGDFGPAGLKTTGDIQLKTSGDIPVD